MAPASPAPRAAKVALVTGGGRGIGRAIALRLARDGANGAITYRSQPARAEEVVAGIEDLGRRALTLTGQTILLDGGLTMTSPLERLGEGS